MKKMISVILALVMALSLCAFASAEENTDSALISLTVTSPSGAPALALSVLADQYPANYTYIAADEIAAAFAKKEADFIVAPINAGAKLYKLGKSTYKLAAVVTWGNLFIASQKADLKQEDLNGASVVLFGENTINASMVLYALEKNGIKPGDVSYLASASETQKLLLNDADAIVVTAEPALTAAKITAKKDEKAISSICESCSADAGKVAAIAEKLEILPNAKVAEAALPGCAIRFMAAKEAKELIEKTVAVDPAQFGGEVPADDFYYGE